MISGVVSALTGRYHKQTQHFACAQKAAKASKRVNLFSSFPCKLLTALDYIKLPGLSPCKRPDVRSRSSHTVGSRTQFTYEPKMHIVGLFWPEHAALLLPDKTHIYAVHIIFILRRPNQEDCFIFGKNLFCKRALCWSHLSFHTPSQGSYLSAVIYSLMQHFPIL